MEPEFDKVTGIEPLFEERLAGLLIQMDGSTTRTITALIGDTLAVDIKHQKTIQYQNMPGDVRSYFPEEGGLFLHRVSSLTYQGDCLSDNAVFANINRLSPELRGGLNQGNIPLGLLIANTEYRRRFLEGARMNLEKLQHLFTPVDLPPGELPVKKYLMIKDQRCWFYICETFHLEKLLKYFLDFSHKS
jgi:chorismate-pyruvate lyase